MFPNAVQIDLTKGTGRMKFFTILNRRAHAFICSECQWIKLAKVKNSTLRSPDDYVIKHECNEDDSMQSSSYTQSSTQEQSNQTGPSASNSNLSSNWSENPSNTGSTNSMATNESNSMSHRDDSMSSHFGYRMSPSMRSSDMDDSGFRTPDVLDQQQSLDPMKLYCCENRFTHTSSIISMKIDLKCQFKSHENDDFLIHQKKCPLRYRSKMARSNPAYLSKFIWSLVKELEISDYLGAY